MDDQALLRYSRHILLDEIGIEGQEALLAARVLVVGCGGLGAAAVPYLAAAGVGMLRLADHDRLEWSNLQRQVAYRSADVGRLKVEAAADAVAALNPAVRVEALAERLDAARLAALMADVDVVLDCCDNFETRQAVNAASVATRTPLVSGAAVRFDGQLAVFDPRVADAPCYHCLFGGEAGDDGPCALFGVFSPLVGVIGAQQAVEALKLLAGIGTPLTGRLLTYDALSARWREMRFRRDPACPVCAGRDHGV